MGWLQRLLWSEGPTALDPKVTETTWGRFFDPVEPVFALVAESEGRVLGLNTPTIYELPCTHDCGEVLLPGTDPT